MQPIEMQALLTNINAGIVDQELPTQLCAGALCLGWYLNLKSTGPWKTDLSSIVERRSLLSRVQASINILAQCIQRIPHASTRAHSCSHKSSIQKMLKKDLRRKAYHPRAVQALKAPDAAKRAEDFLDAVMMDFHISSELMRPFFISRALSTSTMPSPWPPRINPHVYIERDTQKKSWGDVVGWSHQVIGPFFFDSSVTGDVYLNLLKRSV